MSFDIAAPTPIQGLLSRSRFGLPFLLSIVFHGVIWKICQDLDMDPVKPPEHVIEATLVTIPRYVPAPPPPSAAPIATPKPSEPKIEKPAPKKPDKPKPPPKPKPNPVPMEPVVHAPPVAAPPTPPVIRPVEEPVTPASEIGGHLGSVAKRYPPIALQRGWEGTTILEVQILANGTTGRVRILESSGHDILDDEAIESVKSAHWNPARRGSTPVDSIRKLPFKFALTKK